MERHPGMNRISKTERLTFTGPAGTIEALMDAPAGDAIGMAVVCHPHPQHGGTMHNKVVHTIAREFARCGYTALRFNFRGTEGSEGAFDNGRGELGDALAAIEWLRDRCGSGPLWLAGFSFGAAIAIRAAVNVRVDGLISVAPAVRSFAAGLAQQPDCPWLIIQGDQDELVGVEETLEWVNSLAPGPELLVVPGAEHFFHGRLDDLRAAVKEFVERG
jgi:alpha/beta superfamily hydrolase